MPPQPPPVLEDRDEEARGLTVARARVKENKLGSIFLSADPVFPSPRTWQFHLRLKADQVLAYTKLVSALAAAHSTATQDSLAQAFAFGSTTTACVKGRKIKTEEHQPPKLANNTMSTVKPDRFFGGQEVPKALDAEYAGSYIHPSLEDSYDPKMGRLMRTSTPVTAGTVLIIDSPNLACSRLVPPTQSKHCPLACIEDVIWCDENCHRADEARHSLECSWLEANGASLRRSEGEYNFTMLWFVVRIMIERYLELHNHPSRERQDHTFHPGFERGWDSVKAFRANRDIMPQDRLECWTRLIQTYTNDKSLSPALLNLDETLLLICQEEMNSFWLYSTILPAFPPHPSASKLEPPYGLSFYPWATRNNHSCTPNVVYRANSRQQMVMIADRDISANEELRIPYVDFVEYVTFQDRRRRLKDLFLFDCVCERCLEEGAQIGERV
ncbi:MAG: hypothetical protein Q9224_004948 [Gallowayella concinna]